MLTSVLEIAAAVFAAFGFVTVLSMIKERLLYPRRVREKVFLIAAKSEEDSFAADYAKYLVREGKILQERLIILPERDIMIKEISEKRDDRTQQSEQGENPAKS